MKGLALKVAAVIGIILVVLVLIAVAIMSGGLNLVLWLLLDAWRGKNFTEFLCTRRRGIMEKILGAPRILFIISLAILFFPFLGYNDPPEEEDWSYYQPTQASAG